MVIRNSLQVLNDLSSLEQKINYLEQEIGHRHPDIDLKGLLESILNDYIIQRNS